MGKAFLDKVRLFQSSNPNGKVSSSPWCSPDALRDASNVCQRNINQKFPSVQKSLRLYLGNKETEFILFRPIRNEVMAVFLGVLQTVTNEFTSDEQVIIAFPSQEQ